MNEKLKKYVSLLRKQNIKVREATRMKDMFLANTSHELRTPLNSILGYSQLMRQKMKDPYYFEKMDKIIFSAEKLLAIINDILLLTEMSSERLTLQIEEMGIRELIRDSLIMNASHLQLKKIDVRTEIFYPSSHIFSDKIMLKQILFNLISNAIKYSDNNSEIKIEVSQSNDNDNFVVFSIIDKGIGIEADDMNKIFLEFVQVQDGFNRDDFGLGIGLAVTKTMVEKLGGRIWVESEINKGSTFHFSIPNMTKEDIKSEHKEEQSYIKIIEKNKSIKEEHAKRF